MCSHLLTAVGLYDEGRCSIDGQYVRNHGRHEVSAARSMWLAAKPTRSHCRRLRKMNLRADADGDDMATDVSHDELVLTFRIVSRLVARCDRVR